MDWDRVFAWASRVKRHEMAGFRYVCPTCQWRSPNVDREIAALHTGERHEVTAHGGRVS